MMDYNVDFGERRFFELAYEEGSAGLVVDADTRTALKATLFTLWENNEPHWPAKKALRPLAEQANWQWPEAEAAMRKQGERAADARDPVEQAVFLHGEILMRSHHHARREQINSTLTASPWAYKAIEVDACLNTSKKTAPCGWRDGQMLPITPETLGRIPPCSVLGCRCAWLLVDDLDAEDTGLQAPVQKLTVPTRPATIPWWQAVLKKILG